MYQKVKVTNTSILGSKMKVFQFDEISISSDQTAPYIDDDKEDDNNNDRYEQLHLSRYRAVKRLKINNNGMNMFQVICE